jgi:hypothetical protein
MSCDELHRKIVVEVIDVIIVIVVPFQEIFCLPAVGTDTATLQMNCYRSLIH